MNDVKEDLEKAWTSAIEQSEPVSETTVEESGEQQEPTVANVDEWMDAPASYTTDFKEKFKALSPDWREYLTKREKDAERGFSDLGNKIRDYKYIDDGYNSRKDRLMQQDLKNSKEYFEFLQGIDDALYSNPQKTILALADAYKVNLNAPENNDVRYNDIRSQLNNLQQMFTNQQQFIQNQQAAKAQSDISTFVGEKDEAGNAKHPYFEQVKADMAQLISSGVCKDLPSAYERAVWSNGDIRSKLIEAEQAKKLADKAAEADKAKKASFTPASKQEPADEDLTVRQELMKAWEKINS